jgi:hypothetical protein
MRMKAARKKKRQPQVVVDLSEVKRRAELAEAQRSVAATHQEHAMLEGLAEASRSTRRLLGFPTNS